MIRTLALICALVHLCFSEPIRDPERHRVVIVGAGVSGVSAAVTLLENNVTDVIILEASHRIGGRVHTEDYDGITLDRGAEYVHGEVDNTVYELVKPYDLLVSFEKAFNLENTSFLYTNTVGDDFNSSYVAQLVYDAYELLPGNTTFNTSVADYFNHTLDEFLRENNVEPKLGEALRFFTHELHCGNYVPDNLAVLGASTFTDYKNNEGELYLLWKHGSGGYKRLFDILTRKFPNASEERPIVNKTMFGKEVTKISRREVQGDVEVKCADGSTYLADHVIVTLPLGVLKKHAHMFTPALPQSKTDAIQVLGYGNLGKVWVSFPKRWWPENISILTPLFSNQELREFVNSTVHGYWSAYTDAFYPVPTSDRMLVAWYVGQACRTMEELTEEQVTQGIMELLQSTFGKRFNIPGPERVIRTNWSKDPFTLGSYSFHSIDSDKKNLTNSDLATPILNSDNKPVILFAGEATHSHYYGTVHGGLDTGRREAHNVIKYMENMQEKKQP